MTVTKPRFVWSFDFGQVLQTATFLIAVGGLVWYQASTTAEMRRDITSLQALAAVSGPRIEAHAAADNVQNERIANLSDAVRDIRKVNAEMLTQMGGVREDLAGIKARLGVPGQTR